MFSILAFWFASGVIVWPCYRGLLYAFRIVTNSAGEPSITSGEFSGIHLATCVINGAFLPTILATGTTLGSLDENWQYGPMPYAYLLVAVFCGGACGGVLAYFGESMGRSSITP